MTVYNVILFLHILSAFGILVAFAIEWKGLSSLQRSCSKEEIRESLKEFNVLPWIGGSSFLIILLSGIYLWVEAWMGSAWPVIAIISLVVLAVIGAVITGTRMTALGKAVEGGSASNPLPGDISSLPMLWGSLQVRTWMAIGITFLMTVKPGAVESMIVMAISILLALGTNPLTVSFYRRLNVCAVSRHA